MTGTFPFGLFRRKGRVQTISLRVRTCRLAWRPCGCRSQEPAFGCSMWNNRWRRRPPVGLPEYTVPNFQAVASQRTAFTTLARFAAQNNVDIVLRVITWRESADLLRAARTAHRVADVMEIGTTWSGYLAASGRIRSRPDWQKSKGNWRDVLSVPACALPLITEVRLLFYWKRLPSAAPDSPPLTVNNASWPDILDSLRSGTCPGETVAFPIGNSVNLLHDYVSRWSWRAEASLFCIRTCSARVCLSPARALSLCRSILPNIPRSRSVKGKFGSWSAFPEATHEDVTRTFVNGGYRASVGNPPVL